MTVSSSVAHHVMQSHNGNSPDFSDFVELVLETTSYNTVEIIIIKVIIIINIITFNHLQTFTTIVINLQHFRSYNRIP